MLTAREWIAQLRLRRHPEGGWFRETYRSAESVARAALPPRFDGDRAFSTAIYYLLQGEEISALHRIRQDEGWHLYAGSALTLHLIAPDGAYSTRVLGWRPSAGEEPQAVVPAGFLFAATVNDPASYSLAGCTVAPGFDFADFSLPTRAELLAAYPQHRDHIERLTRA
jgi:predicted cupin superfamily sugar epimerase